MEQPSSSPPSLLASQQQLLALHSVVLALQLGPIAARGVSHDRFLRIAEPIAGRVGTPTPFHVLSHAGAKPADALENRFRHEQIARAGIALLFDVFFEVERKHRLISFCGRYPSGIADCDDDAAAD